MRASGWITAGCAALALASAVGPALADDLAYDLAKANPGAMRAFQGIVPARYRKNAWVYRLDGTTSPMTTVAVGGRPFWLGEVCKPHDCGGNSVAFLIAKDGSAAYGLLRSADLTHAKAVVFGTPDAAAQALLEQQIPEQ